MLFNDYNMFVNFCDYEKAEKALKEAMEKLSHTPVSKLDECDARPLVEICGANVIAYLKCGHKEASDTLPPIYKFLFVSKRVDEERRAHFTVHVAAEYKCASCMMQEFRDRMAPCFDRMTWAHGLSAYNRTHTVEGALARLRTTLDNPEWEVCISEKGAEIGPYGLYLKGHLNGLFDGDVWSSVDQETGHRVSEEAGEYEFVGDSAEKYLDKKYDDNYHRYFEGFLTQYHCVGIWVKRSCPRDLKDALRKRARRLGVSFWQV